MQIVSFIGLALTFVPALAVPCRLDGEGHHDERHAGRHDRLVWLGAVLDGPKDVRVKAMRDADLLAEDLGECQAEVRQQRRGEDVAAIARQLDRMREARPLAPDTRTTSISGSTTQYSSTRAPLVEAPLDRLVALAGRRRRDLHDELGAALDVLATSGSPRRARSTCRAGRARRHRSA